MSRCGIVILAAGASVRMGVPKQSLALEGLTLLERVVKTALSSICRPIVVVLGAKADELQTLLNDKAVTIVTNPHWLAGIGTSIRAGITAIRSHALDAAMVVVCDQPLVSAEILNRMLASHFSQKRPITAASYADAVGTPMIFASSLFDELLALEDNQGGKIIANRYPDQLYTFPLPEAELDVDTPADYARLQTAFANPSD